MTGKPQIELTIRYGQYGHESKTVIVPLDESLERELMGEAELSDDPFSLMLASAGMYGGKGDAVTFRIKAFEMRRSFAEHISKLMVPALLDAFGVNDKLDGYKIDELSVEERAWHKAQGRL